MALFLPATATAAAAVDYDYKVELTALAADGLIKGRMTLVPLPGPLCLFTYPNVYSRRGGMEDELEAPFLYPRGFDRGWMKILKVETAGQAWAPDPSIEIPPPLRDLVSCYRPAAGGTAGIEYQVYLPRQYGSFGRYRGLWAAVGGLYPVPVPRRADQGFDFYAPPPPAAVQLQLAWPGAVLIDGRYFPPETAARGISCSTAPYTAAFFYRDLPPRLLQLSQAGFSLDAYLLPEEGAGWRDDLRDSLEKLLWRLRQDIDQGLLPAGGPARLILLEAHLRRFLTARAVGMVPFSDRYLKVISLLARYHELALQRALVESYLEPYLAVRETAADRVWVSELLGAAAAGRWGAKLYGSQRDARQIEAVKLLSFHPALDQVLYTPQFPFVYAFYDSIYVQDRLGHGPELFNRSYPNGRVLLEKLTDLKGQAAVEQLQRDYAAAAAGPFRQTSEKSLGEKLDWFYRQWLAPLPRLNYTLAEVRRSRAEGRVRTEFTVNKEEDRPIREPVEIMVREKGQAPRLLHYDGNRPAQHFSLLSDRPLEVIEIDPRFRLLETDRNDNRQPPSYRFILTSFNAGIDFNSREPYVYLSTQLRRRFGGPNRYNFSAYRDEAGFGFGIGYARLFGRLLDSLRLSHGAALSYSISRLGNDSVYIAETADPAQYTRLLLTGHGWATALTASYFFGDYFSFTNPLSGTGGALFATYGGRALGGDFNYWRLGGEWSAIWPLRYDHLLAFRAALSAGLGAAMPTQLDLPLGGLYGERGIAVNDPVYVGRNRALVTAEYRFMVFPDLDVDLHLLRLRKLQLVTFADSGRVTGTKAELAYSRRYGTPFDSDFAGLFALQDWTGDVGAGLRFFFDVLGVRETLLRFDWARRTRGFDLHSWRYYLSFEQSF